MTSTDRGAAALDGLEVAITGRLASMSRDEARAAIARAGGRCVAAPTEHTALLVLGRGGPPLDSEGRPTASLVRARELESAGCAIRIAPEEELLSLLGLEERREGLHRLYTVEQLVRILGVERVRIRTWVRLGLIAPTRVVQRLCFFDFQQVVEARALSELWRSGVGLARIQKSLAQLAWLPAAERSLLQLAALGDGPLLVRLEDGSLAETSGQLLFGFADGEPREDAPPPATRMVARAPGWFERGVQAEEEGRLADAEACYRHARTLGGEEPEILFNLGNVLYALGRKDEAAASLALATRVDAEYLEAWNNLGNALLDLGRDAEAVASFRRALAIAPSYADAHFNLAEALLARGEVELARAHWRSYLAEDPSSSWADEVRERLGQTEPDPSPLRRP